MTGQSVRAGTTSSPAHLSIPGRDGARRRRERELLPRILLEDDVVEVPPRHRVALAAAPSFPDLLLPRALRGVIAPLHPDLAHGQFLLRAASRDPPDARGPARRPLVLPYAHSFDLESFRRVYTVDSSRPSRSAFSARGRYELGGRCGRELPPVLPAAGRPPVHLGTDRLRRDCSRAINNGAAHLAHHSASSASRCRSALGPALRRPRTAISAAGSIT
jgi:hypothetical protein